MPNLLTFVPKQGDMNIFLAEQLSKSFGEKELFSNITFGIAEGQKVALIARNGTGKSTLLRIIAGKETADTGTITFRKQLKVAYLPQLPLFRERNSVLAELFNTGSDVMQAISAYEHCLWLSTVSASHVQNDLQDAINRMDALNAWDYEARVKEILTRFEITDLDQQVSTLSGGQRKKLALAKTLLENADLLILDEPTNHLDINMIEHLEDYLSRQRLSLLLVTHDRYFLDSVCDEILEMEEGNIYRYKGNYSYFLEKKAEREAIEATEKEKALNLYRTELEWMRRMPSARGTKAKARKDAFYELQEKANRSHSKNDFELNISMNRLGGKILEINNICKSYGENTLIYDFSYTFKKGDRIGIIGKNGVGKSTLLNLLSAKERPDNGRIVAGQTLVTGYYSQEGFLPKEDKRVIDLVKDIAEEIPMGKSTISATQFLHYFGFSYTLQYNYFSLLSGGEKRRLYLLMQLIKRPNFLILDEPTNDLDVFTLALLENFLIAFEGCLVIVSHDRFFLDKLVDHVFVFEGNGKIKDHYGNYSDYYRWKIAEDKRKRLQEKSTPKENQPVKQVVAAGTKPTYKQQKEYEALTQEIAALEAEKHQLVERMNSGAESVAGLQELSCRFAEIEKLLAEKEDRWLQLAELF